MTPAEAAEAVKVQVQTDKSPSFEYLISHSPS